MRDDYEDSEEMEGDEEVDMLDQQKEHDFRLYTLLEVAKDVSQEDIKKAYRRVSLKVHPDKNPNDPEAAEKFQKVNEAYVILSDPKRRQNYDLTGEIDQDEVDQLVRNTFNSEDIDNFATRYKNGPEEEEDLIEFYERNKGDMTEILGWIPLSHNSDVERFIQTYDKLIKEKRIKALKRYKETKNNVNLIQEDLEEAKEAHKLHEEHKKSNKREKKSQAKGEDTSFQELQNRILAKKEKSANSFINSLQSKYCGAEEDMYDMPDEEAFQKARKNVTKNADTKKKSKPKSKKTSKSNT